jgi:hypothetical protein
LLSTTSGSTNQISWKRGYQISDAFGVVILLKEGKRMAELKVRNLSEQDLAALNDAAKHSRLSREEYLRMLIHHDATDHLLSGDVSDLRELTKQMAVIIEQNTKAYLDFVDAVRKLRLPNEN